MGIDVFMIIACREIAQLPLKAFAAGVVLAGCAPAIPSPVAERFGNALQDRAVGDDAAPFPRGDVVGRIKTYRGQIAESAHLASLKSSSHRVAAILDEPEVVLAREGCNGIEIEG